MSIPGGSNPLLLTSAAGGGGGGYEISRSLRFNSSDSAYLSRTAGTPTASGTWTFSVWVKRAKIGSDTAIFGGRSGGSATQVYFKSDNTIRWYEDTADFSTTAVFRDTSAWYHFVFTKNGTTACTIYVNGVQLQQTTSSIPSTSRFNTSSAELFIGAVGLLPSGVSFYGDQYLTDTYFIDGQALTPSSFGQFDANGTWQPKAYSGTYGANGFKLSFSDNSTAAALGTDTSGAGNNWSVSNISATTGGPTSVASASGALPIYNTTDTYGATKGTGTRTDSNASSLSLCVPMGTSSGLSLTDEQPAGRTAVSVTITNSNVVNTTSFSKYYGGSASFNGTSSRLTGAATSDHQFGTGDFTVEGWFYQTADRAYPSALEIGSHLGASGLILITRTGGVATIYSGGFYGAAPTALNTWNHIAWVRSSGTLRIYVNGVLGSTATFTNNLTDLTGGITIGHSHSLATAGYYFPGYIQDFRIYKGVAKYTSNFNPPSVTQNVTIAAGNDSLVDSPVNGSQVDTGAGGEVRGNYCTWNPLQSSGATLTNGNLDCTTAVETGAQTRGTIAVSTGKWYWEISVNTTVVANNIGVIKTSQALAADRPGYFAGGYAYVGSTGNKENNASSTSYGATYGSGDVIGVALDLDAGTLVFYKNGASQGTAFSSLTGEFMPCIGDGTGGSALSMTANFGQRQWAYQAPAGFKALCTTNLPTPTGVVAQPSTAMDVKLYTGNGSTNSITGLGFSPDLVWIKARSIGYWHRLIDSVRGAQKFLYSNVTDAEGTSTANDIFTSFDSTGFTLGGAAPSADGLNQNTLPYVAWCWDAGSSTVTNTQGSITSSVRANASAGFSIVTYTGNGTTGATVGHGLNVAPQMIFTKMRNSGIANWNCWHASLASGHFISLNTTNASGSQPAYFTTTLPTSSVFYLGNDSYGPNANGITQVAYCWSPVAGYSSFGSYTGNGSADGPFVYTGFRPRWLMIKVTNISGESWVMKDAARGSYNPNDPNLYADLSIAEQTGSTARYIDFTSNGFKLRGTEVSVNGSGNTYVYMCFAESPFQFARAR